jgi:hypothetical protein
MTQRQPLISQRQTDSVVRMKLDAPPTLVMSTTSAQTPTRTTLTGKCSVPSIKTNVDKTKIFLWTKLGTQLLSILPLLRKVKPACMLSKLSVVLQLSSSPPLLAQELKSNTSRLKDQLSLLPKLKEANNLPLPDLPRINNSLMVALVLLLRP